jgi:ferredoxin-thioredoxin reductase catalytic subunit
LLSCSSYSRFLIRGKNLAEKEADILADILAAMEKEKSGWVCPCRIYQKHPHKA